MNVSTELSLWLYNLRQNLFLPGMVAQSILTPRIQSYHELIAKFKASLGYMGFRLGVVGGYSFPDTIIPLLISVNKFAT